MSLINVESLLLTVSNIFTVHVFQLMDAFLIWKYSKFFSHNNVFKAYLHFLVCIKDKGDMETKKYCMSIFLPLLFFQKL